MKLAGKYSAYAQPFSPGAEKRKIALASKKQAGRIPSLSQSLGASPISHASSAWRLMEEAGGGFTQYS
jgi:hypothetical protein